jgi:NADH-quinone oxidoreductase subunit N
MEHFLDFAAGFPIACVAVAAAFLPLLSLLKSPLIRVVWSVSWLFVAWCFTWSYLFNDYTQLGLSGHVYVDPLSLIFQSIILLGTALTLIIHARQFQAQKIEAAPADIDALVLFAAIGGMVMVSAADLIVIFLGFELLSVCVYVLTGTARAQKASAEGALKYFVLGAFSSAFLLYGAVLIYGATGSMVLHEIGSRADANNLMLLAGLGLIIFGFGFKVSLVPFHFWAPDVYQGAPTSLAGFMASVVKAAAFGAFLRIIGLGFGDIQGAWRGGLWVLCVLSMTVGNLVALRQTSFKRMLAYSSVAHAGYALIGFVALKNGGGAATVFYLLAYTVMTIGAFGMALIVSTAKGKQYEEDSIESFSGAGWTNPFVGIGLTVVLLSLGGMPPTVGFIGKLYLFQAAVSGGFTGLAIIAALNSLVSLYYYLYVIKVMYFGTQGQEQAKRIAIPGEAMAVVGFSVFAILYLGLFSDRFHSIATLVFERLS